MKKTKIFMSFMAVAIMAISCSNDDLQDITEAIYEQTEHHAVMLFNSNVPSFEGKTTRSMDEWENGSKVYLQFSSGVYGVATYNAANEEWSILYYGTLDATNDGKCEAYYFENAGETSFVSVTLNNSTIIYTDKSASYSMKDNTLTVTANLKPMTGRIRFKGSKANQEYSIEGNWLVCTNYNFTTNTFTKETKTITAKVNKDTYSDYLYCLYPEDEDEEGMEIIFNDKESNTSFTRTLGNNVLAAGKSGYLDIPTSENTKGWSAFKFKDFTVANVTFRMMRVVAGTEDIPKSYYIGETEVTQALYAAVMNTTSSSPQCPIANVSYSTFLSFIEKLNEKTGMVFRLPTIKEWQFAAQGGHLTKGYTYSGSNTVDDVAWYSENSGGIAHDVKTKQPNEIGIYDMSGNVQEWTSEKYSGSAYYYCGGNYSDYMDYVTPTNYSFTSYANNNIGIRLVTN